MRLWPKHWHAETWICSSKGHVAPARYAETIAPSDASLGSYLSDGRRLSRCLRCDCWIEHPEPKGKDIRYARIPTLDSLEKPRRDKVLHDAIFTRLIAINKGVHAAVFSLLAVALILLKTRLGALKSLANRIRAGIDGPIADTGQGSAQTFLQRQLDHILHFKGDTITTLLILALVYAVVEWAEAVGLWKEKHWAEYLTAVATAGFLPLEIHELTKKVTVLRVGALVINVALLVWLIVNKRLFGVRGGHKSLHTQTDWNAILATPRPATGKVSPAATVEDISLHV